MRNLFILQKKNIYFIFAGLLSALCQQMLFASIAAKPQTFAQGSTSSTVKILVHTSIDKSFDKPKEVSVTLPATIKDLRDGYASKVNAANPAKFDMYHYGLGSWEAKGAGMGRSMQTLILNPSTQISSLAFSKFYFLALQNNEE